MTIQEEQTNQNKVKDIIKSFNDKINNDSKSDTSDKTDNDNKSDTSDKTTDINDNENIVNDNIDSNEKINDDIINNDVEKSINELFDDIVNKNNENVIENKQEEPILKPKAKPRGRAKKESINKDDINKKIDKKDVDDKMKKTKGKSKKNDDNITYDKHDILDVIHSYFDKQFNKLEKEDRIMNIASYQTIDYNEQIIKVKKGQRLILQIV